MTAFDEFATLNLDAILATIYEVQADLKILTEQLARERQPDLQRGLLDTLVHLHTFMAYYQPSLRRH